MTRKGLIPAASLVAVLAAVGFVAGQTPLFAQQPSGRMRVVASDATARFVVLGLGKSLVFDLPADVHDVLITDPRVAGVVVRSKRRIYVNGAAVGQTNIYFFDADDRQIGGIDLNVMTGSPPAAWENYPYPASVVVFFRGATGTLFSCSPLACVQREKGDSGNPFLSLFGGGP